MNKELKPGDVVWILDRRRVRDGIGPTQMTISSVSKLGWCNVIGNRGTYHVSDIHRSIEAATIAWHERAEAELAVERSRFNKIAAKLSAPFANG